MRFPGGTPKADSAASMVSTSATAERRSLRRPG
jgi:hypothetical protein